MNNPFTAIYNEQPAKSGHIHHTTTAWASTSFFCSLTALPLQPAFTYLINLLVWKAQAEKGMERSRKVSKIC
jgi:hypothetical protein